MHSTSRPYPQPQALQHSHLNPGVVILLAVLTGGIATTWGYTFGTGNQVEQLPIVYRAINPAYLVNDFFVNVNSQFGPRLYFSRLIAFFAQHTSLPMVYFWLTMISNTLIAVISGFFAREIFDRSHLASMVAIVLVMSIKTFWLGDSNTIFGTYLEPSQLAMPFLLLSVWAGIKPRPMLTVLAAGMASLVHPLLGLEVGAIMFGVIILQVFLRAPYPVYFRNKRMYLVFILLSGLVFSGFALLSLLPYAREAHIPDSQFVTILAYLRHPHHYLPSTFGILQYLQAGAFLLAAGAAWLMCRSRYTALRQGTSSLVILAGILSFLCVGGYLFVEIFPQRIWATLQVYRLLFIIKWLGLVMLAGWISRVLRQKFSWAGLYENGVLFLSMMTPPTMVLTILFPAFRDRLRRDRPFLSGFLERGFIPFAVILGCILYGVDARVYVLYPLFMLMAAYLIYFIRTWITIPSSLMAASLALLIIFEGHIFLPTVVMAKIEQPKLELEDIPGDHEDVAAYVRQNTPADAIFLTPPKLGEFRLTAERAIVVDFTAFPFQDSAMLEWQNRMFSCYGKPQKLGWDAAAEMMANYRKIDDAMLRELQLRYHFEYAVLYPETETQYPVLYEGKNYKLVQVLNKGCSSFWSMEVAK